MYVITSFVVHLIQQVLLAVLKDVLNTEPVSYTHLEGKVSQGVKDYLGAEVIAKGSKFSASDFDSLDFTSVSYTHLL